MSEALVPAAAEPVVVTDRGADVVLPALIVDAGPDAVARFLEFFAGRIANPRTRAAYGRAVGQFLAWCEARGLGPRGGVPASRGRLHPDPPRDRSPTVKQHLAAIRVLCDWLVVSQVLPVNPAAAVRGPKHVVTKGATPVLTPAEARKLLEHIDTGTLAGLRDRALFSVMLYSFARVSAVLGMRRQDYFQQGSRGWLRLHEKGGKRHDVPAHHRAAEALDAYLEAAGLEDGREALFQSVDRAGERLTGRALTRRVVLAMIKRRAAAAGLPPSTCCHTFRATGITAYLSNGGTLEHAQQIAGSRVAEDDEALRPHGGHGDGRRDRTYRDLNGAAGAQAPGRSRGDGSSRLAAGPGVQRARAELAKAHAQARSGMGPDAEADRPATRSRSGFRPGAHGVLRLPPSETRAFRRTSPPRAGVRRVGTHGELRDRHRSFGRGRPRSLDRGGNRDRSTAARHLG